MNSSDVRDILLEHDQLFSKTLFEAPRRTPEQVGRLGEPRHHWRARFEPCASFEPINGQWFIDGAKTDERVIRNEVVRALLGARRRNFDGADIALALDVLKAIDRPVVRRAMDSEIRRHNAALNTGTTEVMS